MNQLPRIAALSTLLVAHASMASEPVAVVDHYADMALAKYEDSLTTARTLASVVEALVAKPSASALSAARTAWLNARIPYQQSEVYRFGNAIVDEWEGRVNAWPLDEGLIDYVAKDYGSESDENAFYVANVIANPSLTAGGKTVDASQITAKLIDSLHEVDEVEANVAIGYHAIEFLLWGQDNNGTDSGAGNRPWTDYATGDKCTGGNCVRRGAYLSAASSLLVSDLEDMVKNWTADGAARSALMKDGAKGGLTMMLTGMGSLSYGELAGERMKLGLMLHDPEEEHDCFSDNTHNSHFYDALGVQNIYHGRYRRIDGSLVEGPSLSDLVRAANGSLDEKVQADLAATMARMTDMKRLADSGDMAYDQMLAEDNPVGNAAVQSAVDALVVQTKSLENVIEVLGLSAIEFEGSESLDNPTAVFQ